MCRLLVGAGADINYVSPKGLTPLLLACQSGKDTLVSCWWCGCWNEGVLFTLLSLAQVEWLIDNGADVSVVKKSTGASAGTDPSSSTSIL